VGATAPAIEISGLSKSYRRRRGSPTIALDDLDLVVEQGGIFGLLGPNGAGKTTTIRCLLGLTRPSSGRCRLLGADSPGGLSMVISRVGALVEGPGLLPGLSARANLEVLARIYGIGPARIEELLERLDLASAGDRPVRGYSHGMRQRLGIAAALLKDCDLVVLDEPASGLDPAGVAEVRSLLRSLADEGRTVFLSSHLLAEVERLCDRVAIIDRGRCLIAGQVKEVLDGGRPDVLMVRVGDCAAGVEVLRRVGIDASMEGDMIAAHVPAADAERVTRSLVAADLYPTELRRKETSLERVYLDLTATEQEEVP